MAKIKRPKTHSFVEMVRETLLSERHQWILWVPFLMACGIIIYFFLDNEPPLAWGIMALVGSVAAFSLSHHTPFLWIKVLAFCLLFITAGFLAIQVRTRLVSHPVLMKETRAIYVIGRIQHIELMPNKKRLVLDSVRLQDRRPSETPTRVRIQGYGFDGFDVGDWIQLRAVLRPPPPPVAPKAFDFQRHMYYQQIGATGYSFGKPIKLATPARKGIAQKIESLRLFVAARVLKVLDGSAGAVTTALTTGFRKQIKERTLVHFRHAGLAHLLSISGLHIGLVAGLVFTFMRLFMCAIPGMGLTWPVKKIAAVAALGAALFYTLMAGAPVPTQRAFIMTAFVLIAVLFDRRGISLRLVMLAATLIILMMPEAVLRPSFQMSFAAVIGLVAFYEFAAPRVFVQDQYPSLPRKIMLYVAAILLTSVVSELATMPLAIHHFNKITLYNMIANLVAMPVVVFWVMPMIVLSYVLMPLGLDALPLQGAGFGVEAILWIARTVTSWPNAVIHVPTLPGYGLLIMVFGGLWLCCWRQRWRVLGVVPMVLGLLTVAFYPQPDILISQTGKLVGIKDRGALYLTTTRSEKFAAEIWQDRFGLSGVHRFKASDQIRCDSLGCLYEKAGHTIAVAYHPQAVAEDCRVADVMITALYANECGANQVIDRVALKTGGAHALFLAEEGVSILNVNTTRGKRPWIPKSYVKSWPRTRAHLP